MIHHLRAFCKGYLCLKVKADKDGFAWILNLLFANEIAFWGEKIVGDEMTFCVFLRDAKRLSEAQNAKEITVLSQHGVPSLLHRYRRRFGVLAGLFCFAFLLFLSGKFVWRVEVTGNQTLSNEEITAVLEDLGCGVGAYIPNLDGYRLSKAYLGAEKRVSWVSVNVVGNVVKVALRETAQAPISEEYPLANLVAKEDGVVLSYAIAQGQSAVGVGHSVRAGELLVSGLVENKTGTHTMTCAKGQVFAEVERILSVQIPQSEVKREQVRVVKREKSVKIFGKTIEFFKKGGNWDEKYDIINNKKEITLFGKIVLPITVTETVYYETREVTLTKDEAQMRQAAHAALDAQMTALMAEAKQILTQGEIQIQPSENGITASCAVRCIVDIAKIQEVKLP